MTYALLQDRLQEALAREDRAAAAEVLREMQPADLADLVAAEGVDRARDLLLAVPAEHRAEVFGHLPLSRQRELCAAFSRAQLASLFTAMSADDRADLYKQLPPEEQNRVLPALATAERENIRKLASYEEGTAGAVMTSEYATVKAEQTAADALRTVRLTAPDKETIYDLFVVDNQHRLLGVVSLRELILAEPSATMDSLMTAEVIAVRAETEQEEAARLIARYDLLALPVLNGGDKLVGIITYDDAMDVVEEEATEDFHKGATVGKIAGNLREASVALLYRKRISWLVVLVFANLFSGAGIAYFEDTIAAYVALVFFLPLLVDSGGNAGSQAATLMVRGLATGEVAARDWARMLGKEVGVALALGITMAVAVSMIGVFRGGPEIAVVVALSMVIIVVTGSLIGMLMPFLLDRLGWDPATASAPLITSVADIFGVLIYFSIASTLLGIAA